VDRVPGQRHQVGVGHLGRPGDEADHHTGLDGQGVDVGMVAHPGQRHHVHSQDVVTQGRAAGQQQGPVDRVLGVQADVADEGQHSQGGPPGELLQHLQPGLEKGAVAPELVDHEPGDELLVGRAQHCQRPDQGGEHPAGVDVTH
jgi:hypothetical protein